ncbi:D-glycero-beta-D-manno-heptose 1-phosphate adenylyltransferase [Streptoalloteichus hindustanus]|uniref:Bifunctional protein HldE n=1 Tax=Streptoalloteichus hindustanus TaxID=2017 RepID=A0A1M5AGM0_STRHI|nr:D-glycero-beta-D-manno-heptose 1-phosphate adenylyltransferase [Streptoalloteichus hindustanus]SHF29440.1 rfaE bifunctional protein, domain I/rfaE bifunctional protein, domain II [Streptoalloteichus hindustanus]
MSTTPLTADLPLRLAERRPRVVVLGDAILDGWLSGECRRLCREAPAPVLEVRSDACAPGGAGNSAANLAALGATAELVTVVGDDPDGRRLVTALRDCGVSTARVLVEPGRRTVAKRRLVAGEQLVARLDEGDVGPPRERAADLAALVLRAAADADAILVADYGLGVCCPEVLDALFDHRDELPPLVVDAHDLRPWARVRPDLVTPNASEAAALLDDGLAEGLTASADPTDAERRVAAVERARAELLLACGAGAAVVTLDRVGAVLLAGPDPEEHPAHRTWAEPAPESHANGAGDTFVATMTAAVATGLPLATAVELAQLAADVVVRRPATSVCTAVELAERLGRNGPVDADHLARLVAEHRAAGRRIVFTNGCFDVLHRGHVAYLNQAKRLGDVLVVAVNDDAGVTRLKGPDRPVNPAVDRAAVLAALSCVDHVVVFPEDTPAALLERLRPDVYVKGGDYTAQMLAEAGLVRRLGGEVRILDYVPDHSTSAVIARIRSGEAVR